jgi:UDP-2,3-diacylglucosamine pyrophosphatase LpxH
MFTGEVGREGRSRWQTMKSALEFRTVIISDVHLGAPDCQIDKVNFFLKHTRCERLILNGDIIDGWSLRRKGGWQAGHTRFVRLVLKKMEKQRTEVIYIRGNHDDVLSKVLPLAFDNLRLVEDFVHEGRDGKRYLCLHGTLRRDHAAQPLLACWATSGIRACCA